MGTSMDVPGTAARNETSAAHGAGGKDMGKKIKCPNCGSLNFEAVASSKKSLSLGKGIVRGVLLGLIGAVGGAMLGKKGKTTFVCHDCGNTWQVKL